MFDRITPTYDLLNHLLSFGVDRQWRWQAIHRLNLLPGHVVLDCGAGTGDMSLAAHRAAADLCTVLLDPAPNMLMAADAKAGTIGPKKYRLVCGVAEALPFPDSTFDRFMVAFGIRNFSDLSRGLEELCRTLKPGGRGVILEFTPDRSRIIEKIFRLYMSQVMRRVGTLVSRDPAAYTYLFETVQNFLPTPELVATCERAGFRVSDVRSLSLGITKLFVLDKS